MQQSIKEQLEQLASSKIGAEKRRRCGRPLTINPALGKVNVTAFPAGMHPVDLKPMKLPRGAPVNVVFTLDSSYEAVVDGLQRLLFPYSKYRVADYLLTTADGALIVEGIPFAEFPFNLGRGGRRILWLVRQEREDIDSGMMIMNTAVDEDYQSGTRETVEGSSIAQMLRDNVKISTHNCFTTPAFGDLTRVNFERLYDLDKADAAISYQSVAILRRFDPSAGRWTETFLTDLIAPNMEDPVLDGRFKLFSKTRSFSMCLVKT